VRGIILARAEGVEAPPSKRKTNRQSTKNSEGAEVI
jgi:hypothetical protein